MNRDDEPIFDAQRIPPHDLGAEAVVIVDSILSPDAFALVADKLAPEDLYSQANRWIYTAIVELTKAGAHVDLVAVVSWLRENERIAAAGGATYVAELVANTPVLAATEEKRDRILAFARARRMIATAQRIAAEGYGVRGDDVKGFLEDSERKVFEIVQCVETSRDVATMSDITTESYAHLVRAEARGLGNVELPTGLVKLDKRVGGLGGERLIVVAARPGLGKTSLVMGFAESVAETGGLVLVFSLEMPRAQLGTRMACSRSGASVHRALNGWLTDRERAAYLVGLDDLKKLPLFIDDTPSITLTQIRAKIRRVASRFGQPVSLIAIDYLQLMMPETAKGATRDRELASITAGLKRLSREIHAPVILLSQLNRDCETREDKRPRLSDLRESGAIEQDADDVIFIYRDDVYHEASNDKGIAELIVAKQRNGPPGTERVAFDGKSTSFRNLQETTNDEVTT